MMPASRAYPVRRPFWHYGNDQRPAVALLMTTRPSATAVRSVAGLAETSTIRASPLASMWVRAGLSVEDLRAMAQRVPVARAASGRASSARVAAATSACRIRLSPTRMSTCRRAQAGEIGRREDAASPPSAVTRDQGRQCLAGRQRGLEVRRSRLLTPIKGDEVSAPIELRAFMDFESGRPCPGARAASSISFAGGLERRHDDQDAVGAKGAGLDLDRCRR